MIYRTHTNLEVNVRIFSLIFSLIGQDFRLIGL